ncbi:MAG: molybdopterin-dependent oxidoreductase, partial [Acidimicrobiaceae bacterium]|nr:molybdopterin-dependent oxidoreductase [Acidimicrobiaceae bacterium]
FAIESSMNKLAEALEIDPVDLRLRNAVVDGDEGLTQAVLPDGVTAVEVISACADRAGFNEPMEEVAPFAPIATLPSKLDAIRRGRGFATSFKNVGFSFGFPERCEAEIHLHGDGEEPTSADLFHGAAEVGQGNHLAMRQMTAEATGVPLDQVRGHFSDTATSGDPGSASASRLTFMSGNSILGASEEADKAWRDGERPAIGRFRYTPPPTEALDAETGKGQPNFSYAYMAQAVEVTVDIGTGHIRVDRVISTHDVGRAINPRMLRGQIEGAVVQAQGYVLSEELQISDGFITNPRLSGYLIPGIGDIPTEVESQILELADPLGPFGARGVAEMPFITYAPAVTAAVHDATGVWFDAFPLTPSRVMAGLRNAGV